MPRQLTISSIPFKSSNLAIPPTPFSPRLPISPPASPPRELNSSLEAKRAAQLKATASLLPPPTDPLHWLWQCHKCNRVYKLGVTRRCLDDGHFFCAGTTVVKRSKKNGKKSVIRHQACASEFDYQGWKSWGVWRRTVAEQVEAAEALLRAEAVMDEEFLPMGKVEREGKWFGGGWAKKPILSESSAAERYWKKTAAPKKNCWEKCDYPSECRWGKQFGVATPRPAVTTFEPEQRPSSQKDESHVLERKASTSFEEILGSAAVAEETSYLEPLSPTKSSEQKATTEGETPKVSMDDLLDSAKRRKRRSLGQIPSPLGLNPPSPVSEADTEIQRRLLRLPSADEMKKATEKDETLERMATRAVDDLGIDLKKYLSGVVVGAGAVSLQEKADLLVKGLKVKKKGSMALF